MVNRVSQRWIEPSRRVITFLKTIFRPYYKSTGYTKFAFEIQRRTTTMVVLHHQCLCKLVFIFVKWWWWITLRETCFKLWNNKREISKLIFLLLNHHIYSIYCRGKWNDTKPYQNKNQQNSLQNCLFQTKTVRKFQPRSRSRPRFCFTALFLLITGGRDGGATQPSRSRFSFPLYLNEQVKSTYPYNLYQSIMVTNHPYSKLLNNPPPFRVLLL